VAITRPPTAMSANAPPTNHAAGSHRRERRRPVGKSKNKKASIAVWITQTQLDSQAKTRPAGTRPTTGPP
jgi:hypothetical protein